MTTLSPYLPEVGFEEVTNPNRFHCQSKVATRFRSGRILLAGDAAHLCTPTQGHGMNTGLQDAYNLAWKLALVCTGAASTDLLDSYEAERRPVAQPIVASGDEIERVQTLSDPVGVCATRRSGPPSPIRWSGAREPSWRLNSISTMAPLRSGSTMTMIGPRQGNAFWTRSAFMTMVNPIASCTNWLIAWATPASSSAARQRRQAS